jgi:ATP-dependent Zn protease
MESKFGLMSFQGGEGVNPYSEKTAQALDQEIKTIVD